jgi:hypothetical protein
VSHTKFKLYPDVRWMAQRINAGTNGLGDEVRLETSTAVE